jgi:hypothetical protein
MKYKKKQNLKICRYYIEEEKFNLQNYNNIEDIEDLLKEGKKKNILSIFL